MLLISRSADAKSKAHRHCSPLRVHTGGPLLHVVPERGVSSSVRSSSLSPVRIARSPCEKPAS